jgi:hypothetical protein
MARWRPEKAGWWSTGFWERRLREEMAVISIWEEHPDISKSIPLPFGKPILNP